MKRFLFAALILLVVPVQASDELTDRAKNATALLYSQDAKGGMRMRCTATAYERTETIPYVYTFVTAAHCVGSDNRQKERVADYRRTSFYITFDQTEQKTFYRANVKSIGYQTRGDDFAEFEVISPQDWPRIPIGDERLEEEGNEILNIASPLGLGRQVFHGHITKLILDRPVVQGDINWQGSILIQVPGSAGGSSGSAIISIEQQAIVGFLVGTIGGSTMTAIPASRFTEFKKRLAEDRYRWQIPEEDQ